MIKAILLYPFQVLLRIIKVIGRISYTVCVISPLLLLSVLVFPLRYILFGTDTMDVFDLFEYIDDNPVSYWLFL